MYIPTSARHFYRAGGGGSGDDTTGTRLVLKLRRLYLLRAFGKRLTVLHVHRHLRYRSSTDRSNCFSYLIRQVSIACPFYVLKGLIFVILTPFPRGLPRALY